MHRNSDMVHKGNEEEFAASGDKGGQDGEFSEEELKRKFEELFNAVNSNAGGEGITLVEQFGRNLTEEARAGKLGPFVGREQELLEIIQALSMRKKNNPVLVGETGVGKTAIVEALAVKAVNGEYPDILANKQIIEINMGLLLSGTQYRGMFEERLTGIIDEIADNPHIILFIDEIHMIVGAGVSDDKAADAANIMKPALAGGNLRCIGATTVLEYEKYIEKDQALERRFNKVLVKEPSVEASVEILKSIRQQYQEKNPGVQISDEVLLDIVELSVQYIPERHLPDKAIDILDKAVAHARFPDLGYRHEESSVETSSIATFELTSELIKQVVSERTGMPVGFDGGGRERFHELREKIREQVEGQDEVVEKVVDQLILSHSTLRSSQKPLSVFLFLGPMGVGKTHFARVIAHELFCSPSKMIRLDMSQYTDESSGAKLIGSAPGYVGYAAEGQLTGVLRKTPYSLVLLDDVDKAHRSVLDLLIRMFDEGTIADAKGRLIDARHAIFVMTANTPELSERLMGFGSGEQERSWCSNPQRTVEKMFGREFTSQIDEILLFSPLEVVHIAEITRNMLRQIAQMVSKEKGVELIFSDDAVGLLADEAYNPDMGAREIDKVIKRRVTIPLSQLDFTGVLALREKWYLTCEDGKVLLK